MVFDFPVGIGIPAVPNDDLPGAPHDLRIGEIIGYPAEIGKDLPHGALLGGRVEAQSIQHLKRLV